MDPSRALDDLFSLSQMQMQIEESRAQGINARGIGLGGFASVVLSLIALGVSSEIRPTDAPGIPGAARYMLVSALVILAAAIALIVGVIWPRPLKDISAAELDSWRQANLSRVRVEALARLSQAIEATRSTNHRKAFFLHWAGVLVVCAIALSAASGAVMAL
jgi:hypothetical protein